MKLPVIFGVVIVFLASCSSRKQASNVTGRTDDVYFTVNDTRKKADLNQSIVAPIDNSNTSNAPVARDPNGYTGTYSNRIRYFGSGRYYYDAYRPSIVPSIYANYYNGWSMGLVFVNPRFGYVTGFNSPFSPYYGINMPFYDPFYAFGYNSMWVSPYYPRYYYNPYFYYPCYYSYGYNSYYYPYYNPGYSNFYNNSKPRSNTQSVRRTGTSNNIPTSNTSTNTPQNSTQPSNQNNSGSKWYNGGNSDRSGGRTGGSTGGGGTSGGNKDRGTSGSNGSQRRR